MLARWKLGRALRRSSAVCRAGVGNACRILTAHDVGEIDAEVRAALTAIGRT